MKKKISVVIPTYQRPKLLVKCLKALAQQTLEKDEFQVIVIHDGPMDDRTTEIVLFWEEHHALNVSFHHTVKKNGPAAARNVGWRYAEADWIAFTDDDCLPEPNWLQRLLNMIPTGRSLAYTGQTIVPLTGTPTDYERNVAHLATASFITANCMIAKKTLEQVGGFDERFEKAFREDSDLEFKLRSNQITIQKVPTAQVVHP